MDRLVLTLHGWESSYQLNEIGIAQMRHLSSALSEALKGTSRVLVLSGAYPPAVTSAKLLADQIGAVHRVSVPLGGVSGLPPENEAVWEYIQKYKEFDGSLILVCQHQMMRDFPSYFMKSMYNVDLLPKRPPVGKSYIIDVGTGQFQYQ